MEPSSSRAATTAFVATTTVVLAMVLLINTRCCRKGSYAKADGDAQLRFESTRKGCIAGLANWLWGGKSSCVNNGVKDGVIGAIGNTPLIRIRSLSEATGCEIFGKAEFLNPGGSVKDRVAVKMIEEALQSGDLQVGGLVTEGSAGSTGSQILEALGATVERVRPVSITHKDHFVNVARRRALEAQANSRQDTIDLCPSYLLETSEAISRGTERLLLHKKVHENGSHFARGFDGKFQGGYFANQFENLANFRAHYEGTGPEIWKQTGGHLDAFVAAAGTGGTLAGISCYLKKQNAGIKCYLIDPPGSGLFNRVTRGVMYAREEAEGKRLKNPFDTITEGIGINRLTENFKLAQLDGAFRGSDREAVEMSRFLLKEGLFLGSSSAMNCVGAVRVAELLGPGHTIVTILCDGGARHLSKFHNPDYLAAHGLAPSAKGLEFLGGKFADS
ncbi:hypothetical protein O6H91_09G101800 [Diphasiastrum complanatum]|uniref:Uncharacterized protein n=1 Tax=Diphasiastrum complanatum TaxID=34168 RepID=A0ACC2CSQ9_DIPCM|nr:hypothetical protein O6H91_09G101800 [Diphasiastrum complanatum]